MDNSSKKGAGWVAKDASIPATSVEVDLGDLFGESDESANDATVSSLADVFAPDKSDETEQKAVNTSVVTPDSVPAVGLPVYGTTTTTKVPAPAKQETRKINQINERVDTKNISVYTWNVVREVLATVSRDESLQKVANSLILTQNQQEHQAQLRNLTEALRPALARNNITLGKDKEIGEIMSIVCDEIIGISVIGPLYRDSEVDEILVDRWDKISIEVGGGLLDSTSTFRDQAHAEGVARGLALKVSSRSVSNSIPLVSAELPGARVTIAFGSVVKGGLSITIRKFRKLLNLTDLIGIGSLNQDMADFLQDCVQCRAGVLVSGGTGTGKTTIINILSSFVPDSERVISIEDAFELQLANKHVVSLQTKEASSMDDTVSITLAELLRNTLRMRPDRIIVGEIREGLGAVVMLDAASTGHEGTMTTIHANSCESAVNERFPALVRQTRQADTGSILRSISNSFDLIIQVSRGRDGIRYISSISSIGEINYMLDTLEVIPVFTGTQTEHAIEFTQVPVNRETSIGVRLSSKGVTQWVQ